MQPSASRSQKLARALLEERNSFAPRQCLATGVVGGERVAGGHDAHRKRDGVAGQPARHERLFPRHAQIQFFRISQTLTT